MSLLLSLILTAAPIQELKLEPVVTGGLSQPLYVCSLPTDAGLLFICQKKGKLVALRDGKVLDEPVLDLSEVVTTSSEQGLLGMAFHPDWPAQPYVYLNYTGDEGTTHVSRFTLRADAPTTIDPESEVVLLKVEQPWANHNAGQLAFSPKDGYLYFGLGDGGAGGDPNNAGQSPDALLGKMLRIDVNGGVEGGLPYGVPSSNPFVKQEGWRAEIWAYGLRNPWRYSFDRKTGDLYIGDVGQNAWEEIDFQPASSKGGENYGWRLFEGLHEFKSEDADPASVVMPVHELPQSDGHKSITGGYVYRGKAMPELQGSYFYGDYVSGHIASFRVVDGKKTDYRDWTEALTPERRLISLVSFGEDADGELYVLCLDGRLFKLVPSDA